MVFILPSNKFRDMVIYNVLWFHKPDLSAGKGKVNKSENMYTVTILCRNSSDAITAAMWCFEHDFKSPHGLTFDDGQVTLTRKIVDSRNFHAHYIYMDGIPYPLSLSDLKGSLMDYALKQLRKR